MNPTVRAVIDIGTNSVKLLVGKVSDAGVEPLFENSEQARLGKGLYESNCLQPEAIERVVKAVLGFKDIAESFGAESIRIVATSAARDAKNGDDFKSAVEKASKLPLEIISGDREAELIFRGVCDHTDFSEKPILAVDAGGGSTELILGNRGKMISQISINLGTVRLLEGHPVSDPPDEAELANVRTYLEQFLQSEIKTSFTNHLEQTDLENLVLVGSGGTSSILARIQKQLVDFNRAEIEATIFHKEQVTQLTERLWKMPLEERKQIIGLPNNRADVILMGAVIFEAILRYFKIGQMHCCTRGLRFAVLLEN